MTKYIGRNIKLLLILLITTLLIRPHNVHLLWKAWKIVLPLCLLHIHPSYFYYSRDTFIEREPGETANDRNDRAIRVAAKWYTEHLKTPSDAEGLKVVLLTNDQGNKQKAEESGLLVYKCKCPLKKKNHGTQLQFGIDQLQDHSSPKWYCKWSYTQLAGLTVILWFKHHPASWSLLTKFCWMQACV